MNDIYRQEKCKSVSGKQMPGDVSIGKNIKNNLQYIEKVFGDNCDFVLRFFQVEYMKQKIDLGFIYIDNLTDRDLIKNTTLEITTVLNKHNESEGQESDVFQRIKKLSLCGRKIKEISDFHTLEYYILSGDAVLLVDGFPQCISIDVKKTESRAVEEPSTQTVVRGPKEGFTEKLSTNISLIRKRVKHPDLEVNNLIIGKITKTNVSVVYIKGIANEKIIREVKERLQRINIDGILESGSIEEYFQESSFSPFPTSFNSERPDTTTAGLLEGRVAVMVDGTPFVLLVPALFVHFFQASEDYYTRFCFTSLIRILRYIAFFFSLLVPAGYVAITTFHQEMIPTPLLISIAAQREGVPFPAYVEVLMMELVFEILREAGIRMPRAIGPAISIVGALVIGQAAVEAGIVSAFMVVVVALTAISSFVYPIYSMAVCVRILRFIFVFLGASFGLYGIIMGLFVMVFHLCSLRSFGVPYMAPLAPFIGEEQKDSILRFPFYKMIRRPKLMSQDNAVRQDTKMPKKK